MVTKQVKHSNLEVLDRNASEGIEPRNSGVKEVESFHILEDNTICSEVVSYKSLFRGLRPWYDTVRKR